MQNKDPFDLLIDTVGVPSIVSESGKRTPLGADAANAEAIAGEV